MVGLADVKSVDLKASQITRGDENLHSVNRAQPTVKGAHLEAALECEIERDSRSDSEAIASLERRTVQNLYISQEAKDRVKQGTIVREMSVISMPSKTISEAFCETLFTTHPACL